MNLLTNAGESVDVGSLGRSVLAVGSICVFTTGGEGFTGTADGLLTVAG